MGEINQDLINVLEAKNYKLVSEIGRGGTSTCFLVFSTKYHDSFVCKRMNVSGNKHDELTALIRLSYNGIIKLYDFHIYKDLLYLFLEYCPNGSLQSYVKENGHLTGAHLRQTCYKIIQSLEYIHSKHFAHLDIKPDNILLDRYGRAKLADFGLAKCIVEKDDYLSNQRVGTLHYMAPEIINQTLYDPFKADIWSLGVTFYYLASGEIPFGGNTIQEIEGSIKFGEIPYSNKIPKDIFKVLRQMMCTDPLKRPSCEALLALPVFNSCHDEMEKLPKMICTDFANARIVSGGAAEIRKPKARAISMNEKISFNIQFKKRASYIGHLPKISTFSHSKV